MYALIFNGNTLLQSILFFLFLTEKHLAIKPLFGLGTSEN